MLSLNTKVCIINPLPLRLFQHFQFNREFRWKFFECIFKSVWADFHSSKSNRGQNQSHSTGLTTQKACQRNESMMDAKLWLNVFACVYLITILDLEFSLSFCLSMLKSTWKFTETKSQTFIYLSTLKDDIFRHLFVGFASISCEL